jgi:dienelactone hydrolase
MFTDIVGYTALMGRNSAKALELLHFSKEIQKPLVEKYNGKWVKEIGDGALAQFNTALDAVNCAIEIQAQTRAKLDAKLRIGIHLGDITIEDEDVYGDGVNIASRLESLSDPGGIYISDAIWKSIQGQTDLHVKNLGKVRLKNVGYKVRLYSIQGEGLPIPVPKRTPLIIGMVITILLVLGYFGYHWLNQRSKAIYTRNELIPEIREMIDSDKPGWEIHKKIELAKINTPNDPELAELVNQTTFTITVKSEPPNASVFVQDYFNSTDNWKLLAKTPTGEVRIPKSTASKLKVMLEGYNSSVLPLFGRRTREVSVKLHRTEETPLGMVYIKGQLSRMRLVGFDHLPSIELGDFWIDKFEVTNKEFKEFVDQGGYQNQKYWKHKIIDQGKELSFDEAIKLFKDKTGMRGPASWEAGSYPDGKGDFPVGGVSWYEAAAYAEFLGKKLPSIYHWDHVASVYSSGVVVPMGNMDGSESLRVGEGGSMNNYGAFDMAGNVREWVYNEESKTGDRFILGGGWDDAAYAFTDAYSLPPINRNLSNGIRCILPVDSVGLNELMASLENPSRDFNKERPVDEHIFNLLIRQYSYDKGELDPVVLSADSSSEWWIKQKIEINAAYGAERLPVYILLPKDTKPPYQTIVYFPGDGGFYVPSSDNMSLPDFHIKSGRALVIPIYKSIYERQDELKSSMPNMTNQYREHVIMWSKDLMRTVDYLEQTGDFDMDKLAYLGYSWGGRLGPIMIHNEKRFKTGILWIAGLRSQRTLPEADPFNFLPRVTIPILMLNGEYDYYFPVESSQRPMFENLGTPEADKVWKIYDGSHNVPRTEMMKESLTWLNRYLGPVYK